MNGCVRVAGERNKGKYQAIKDTLCLCMRKPWKEDNSINDTVFVLQPITNISMNIEIISTLFWFTLVVFLLMIFRWNYRRCKITSEKLSKVFSLGLSECTASITAAHHSLNEL